jgi:hypothetical protein
MKRLNKIALTAMGLALMTASGLRADNFSGNQLQGKTLPPVTERPATIVGPTEDLTTPKGATLLTLQSGSILYIVGGSTLHQYELGAKSLKGSAFIKGSLAKALNTGKTRAALDIPVTFLKSKESGLDNNAYKALKAPSNPDIRFDLKSVKATGEDATLKGSLTIAGITQPVVLNAKAKVVDNSVEFSGVQKLKMTDYQITPPSVSLVVTSITCTDEIEIHYDVTFATAKEEAHH